MKNISSVIRQRSDNIWRRVFYGNRSNPGKSPAEQEENRYFHHSSNAHSCNCSRHWREVVSGRTNSSHRIVQHERRWNRRSSDIGKGFCVDGCSLHQQARPKFYGLVLWWGLYRTVSFRRPVRGKHCSICSLWRAGTGGYQTGYGICGGLRCKRTHCDSFWGGNYRWKLDGLLGNWFRIGRFANGLSCNRTGRQSIRSNAGAGLSGRIYIWFSCKKRSNSDFRRKWRLEHGYPADSQGQCGRSCPQERNCLSGLGWCGTRRRNLPVLYSEACRICHHGKNTDLFLEWLWWMGCSRKESGYFRRFVRWWYIVCFRQLGEWPVPCKRKR